MEASLKDLNFLQVRFEIKISPLGKYTKNGSDDVEFLVSTNPGEDVKPLGQVASGVSFPESCLVSNPYLLRLTKFLR